MADTPTIIPTLTPDQFAARMSALFPNGWSSVEAKTAGGLLFSVMGMLGDPLAFIDSGIIYADDATRIDTATNGALDLASLDYFGSGTYALPRNPGESDALFSARILAALLPTGATRQAVSDAIEAVTGVAPRIIEPWSPADTGVIDGKWVGGSLLGAIYIDIDTATTPGRITDPSLGYQGFIESVLPSIQPIGVNAVPCMDSILFMDSPGSSMFDFEYAIPLGEQLVYDAINRNKCEGTIAWVRFTGPGGTGYWDIGGNYWDEPDIVWS